MPPGKARTRPNLWRRIPKNIKQGTAVLIAGGIYFAYAIPKLIDARRTYHDPATYTTPEVRRLEAAGEFHNRDLAALGHERLYGRAFDPHAEALEKIAGDRYNIPTVISILGNPKRQILSRRDVGYGLRELERTMGELDASLAHQNKLLAGHWATERDKKGFKAEVDRLNKQREELEMEIDVIRRADELYPQRLNSLLKTIHERKIGRALHLRKLFYNGDWEKATKNRTSSRIRPRGELHRGRERRPGIGRGVKVAQRAPRRVQHRV